MRRFLIPRLRRRGSSAENVGLVADTEAFLSGDYACRLHQRKEPVPGWARLNTFAHRDPKDLLGVHGSIVVHGSTELLDSKDRTWSDAVREVASELTRAVGGDPETLAHVQRHVLVPLELRLMAEPDLTAPALVGHVRTVLRSNIP